MLTKGDGVIDLNSIIAHMFPYNIGYLSSFLNNG